MRYISSECALEYIQMDVLLCFLFRYYMHVVSLLYKAFCCNTLWKSIKIYFQKYYHIKWKWKWERETKEPKGSRVRRALEVEANFLDAYGFLESNWRDENFKRVF